MKQRNVENERKMKFNFRKMVNAISLISCIIALFATIWIIVPAISPQIWLLSVLSSEWSLGFGALASLGIVANFFTVYFGKGKLSYSILIIGAFAIALSLYPFFSALIVAREQNVSLSFSQYAQGFWGESNFAFAKKSNFETRTFAVVENVELKLDTYLPAKEQSNGAGLIVVHGGSWNGGARSDFPAWNQWFAAQGYTVFDVDYRLLQPNWRTATGDIKCAVIWIKQHAAEFQISPEKIALLGRSAGGHLALIAAYTNEAEFPSTCPNATFNGDVKAVISFYAPTDLVWDYEHPANERVIKGTVTLQNFLGGNPHQSDEMRERYVTTSPVAQVKAQTPPTLLFHGGFDQLVYDENLKFLDERLTTANVQHKSVIIGYAQHGFDFNFNGFGSQIAKPVMLDFLKRNLF